MEFNNTNWKYSLNESFSSDYNDPFDDPLTKLVFICAYTTVSALCVFGNVMVLLAIIKSERLRSLTNFFLANLAVADFWIGVFCVLPNLSFFISQKWILGRNKSITNRFGETLPPNPFGREFSAFYFRNKFLHLTPLITLFFHSRQAMCKIYYFVWNMSYTASIVILTAIATERYIAIRFPLRARRYITQRRLFIVQGTIWMIAAVYGLPYLFIFDLKNVSGVTGESISFCFPDYSLINMKALVTANFIVWYAFPLFLMTYMYCRIGIILWKVSKNVIPPNQQGQIEMPSRETNQSTSSSDSTRKPHQYLRFNRIPKNTSNECTMCKVQNSKNNGNVRPDRELKNCMCSNKESNTPKSRDTNIDYSKNVDTSNEESIESRQSTSTTKLRIYFTSSQTRMNSLRVVRSRRRVIRLLVAVVVSFAVCVLPHHIRVLLLFWEVPMYNLEGLLSPFSFLILYLNSALNPILYALFSANFRKSFKDAILCTKRRLFLCFSANNT